MTSLQFHLAKSTNNCGSCCGFCLCGQCELPETCPSSCMCNNSLGLCQFEEETNNSEQCFNSGLNQCTNNCCNSFCSSDNGTCPAPPPCYTYLCDPYVVLSLSLFPLGSKCQFLGVKVVNQCQSLVLVVIHTAILWRELAKSEYRVLVHL